MKSLYADLHIHIGRSIGNLPIKITAAKSMTFEEVIKESSHRKGIQMIGIIDAHSPPVQEEIEKGLQQGLYTEHVNGGIVFEDTTCILGAEIELREDEGGPFHVLTYFPTFENMRRFTSWLSRYMKNTQLSTQRLYQPSHALEAKVMELEGLLIPAHAFTPFKSVYGSSGKKLCELFDLSKLAGVELGLSSDSYLADELSELRSLTFLTNSDAHSIPRIGREYNEIALEEASFQDLKYALFRKEGRKVTANYGLNPELGKYYRTRCVQCEELWLESATLCPYCGFSKSVKGVYDRIREIRDQEKDHPNHRSPYIYQVPLEFIPGLGKKKIEKLLSKFKTEMNILHYALIDEIGDIVGSDIAHFINLSRERRLRFEEGGGGVYGKVSI